MSHWLNVSLDFQKASLLPTLPPFMPRPQHTHTPWSRDACSFLTQRTSSTFWVPCFSPIQSLERWNPAPKFNLHTLFKRKAIWSYATPFWAKAVKMDFNNILFPFLLQMLGYLFLDNCKTSLEYRELKCKKFSMCGQRSVCACMCIWIYCMYNWFLRQEAWLVSFVVGSMVRMGLESRPTKHWIQSTETEVTVLFACAQNS